MASHEIRVVNDDQRGISGVEVGIEFTSIARGMAHERTDSDGSAYFDDYDEGDMNVYLDGSSYGRYYFSDGGCTTITK